MGDLLYTSEAFNSPRVVVTVAAVAAVAAVAVGDYFVFKVNQIDGRCAILLKKYQFRRRGELLFLSTCILPIDLTHFIVSLPLPTTSYT